MILMSVKNTRIVISVLVSVLISQEVTVVNALMVIVLEIMGTHAKVKIYIINYFIYYQRLIFREIKINFQCLLLVRI